MYLDKLHAKIQLDSRTNRLRVLQPVQRRVKQVRGDWRAVFLNLAVLLDKFDTGVLPLFFLRAVDLVGGFDQHVVCRHPLFVEHDEHGVRPVTILVVEEVLLAVGYGRTERLILRQVRHDDSRDGNGKQTRDK